MFKTVKSSSISGMNGRNRLYDDDLFADDRYKSPTTRKFQGEKRDEDIRLIPNHPILVVQNINQF